MRKISNIRLIQLSTAELAVAPYSTRVWKRKECVENTDTHERRQGDGTKTWAQLAPTGVECDLAVDTAATSNVVIATALENGDTVAGKVMATGEVALLMAETDNTKNGPYAIVASGAASRLTGFTTFDSIAGKCFRVKSGTNAGKVYRCISAAGGTLNTDPLLFLEVKAREVNLAKVDQLAGVTTITSFAGTELVMVQNGTSKEWNVATLANLKTYFNS